MLGDEIVVSIDKILDWKTGSAFDGFKEYFAPESIRHPAKAICFMLEWIIKKYTKEGDVVLDPMAGTGSTGIIASLLGRNAVLVEYEQKFVDMIEDNIKQSKSTGKMIGWIKVIKGDARILSYTHNFDCAITSPPYGNRESDVKINDGDPQRMGYRQSGATETDNIGFMKSQSYLQAMFQVYSECYKVLKTDGLMVLITKNFIRKKRIVRLDLDTIKMCEHIGFKLIDRWYRRNSNPSFWVRLYYKKYGLIVEYEDILVFRKIGEGGNVDTIISSPPYAETLSKSGGRQYRAEKGIMDKLGMNDTLPYSSNKNNIGNLKYGKVDQIIFSPPYGIKETSQETSKKEIERRIKRGIKGAVVTKDGDYMTGGGKYLQKYSTDKNNIGNLPYEKKLNRPIKKTKEKPIIVDKDTQCNYDGKCGYKNGILCNFKSWCKDKSGG